MATTVANILAKSATGATGPTQRFSEDSTHTRQIVPANVGMEERLASLAGGALLMGYGLTCRGLSGVLLPLAGGVLLLRGVTGSCQLYHAMGINTNQESTRHGVTAGHGYKIEEVITINKPARELYAFWRQFERLPEVMTHLKEVRQLGNGRSHWVARAPLGLSVEWDAEIVNQRDGELIAWQSLPGSDVNTAGSVHFISAPGNRGTEVRVTLKYDPPAGKLGAWFASLFGEDPSQQIREDLRRFKQRMETGEFATIAGQPSGRR